MTKIIIYEVNLEVDSEIQVDFAVWLPGHVQRVLAAPGFLDAVIEIEERQSNQLPVFCVRYRLQDREALETYLENHAAAMRQEGIDRFGDRFRATRRILACQPTGRDSEIRSIASQQTHALRHSVLRPNQPADQVIYPDDNAPATRHLGIYCKNELIGIASVYYQALPGHQQDDPANSAWRLRGMAVHPDWQRRGLGSKLVSACLACVAACGGSILWCNARSSASSFYRRQGFEAVGEAFEIEGIGAHYVMQRALR